MLTPRYVIYLLLLLSTLFVALTSYKSLNKPFRLITFLVMLVFVSECTSSILAYSIGNSFPAYHFLTLFQLVFHILIYRQFYLNFHINTRIPNLAALISFFIIIGLYFYDQSIYSFPSDGIIILSLFIISNAAFLYKLMLRAPIQISLFKQEIFWFNTGNWFFYSITFFVFGFFNYFQSIKEENPEWMYDLIWFANMFLYSSYLASFILNKKSKI